MQQYTQVYIHSEFILQDDIIYLLHIFRHLKLNFKEIWKPQGFLWHPNNGFYIFFNTKKRKNKYIYLLKAFNNNLIEHIIAFSIFIHINKK